MDSELHIEKYSPVRPPLSIGVVTHDRADTLRKLLQYLIPAIEAYGCKCEVIVANNSGAKAHEQIDTIVVQSNIRTVCDCRVIDSSKNNISTGRNVVLEHACEEHVVFIDDDEYPVSTWLVALVDAMHKLECTLVAGPIIPVFSPEIKSWVCKVDLHNTIGLTTGDQIKYAASGNILVNRKGVEDVRFSELFGNTGGEDTEFFLQLKDKGRQLYWSSEAVVYEDIPASKSTPEYMIQRFMTQGRSYRSIKERRGEINNRFLFVMRAALIASVSIVIAKVLAPITPDIAATWMKRGYSNLGKFIKPRRYLYE